MLRCILAYAFVLFSVCGGDTLVTNEANADWPFFAFDNGVGRGEWNPEQQAEVLAELGYDGIGYTGLKNVPSLLEAMRKHNLRVFSTYLAVDLEPGTLAYDPALPQAVKQFEGSGAALWLHVHAKGASAGSMDDRAVEVIGNIADMAKESGLPVVLYPHTGFYVATTSDAVRLVSKLRRENVGVSFNLCHFLRQTDESELEDRLAEAAPYLSLVSINGCDSGDTQSMGWDRLIQRLDKGSFDVKRVLQLLQQHGYQGPVGLQCYQIKGDIRDSLRLSIKAWKNLNSDQ